MRRKKNYSLDFPALEERQPVVGKWLIPEFFAPLTTHAEFATAQGKTAVLKEFGAKRRSGCSLKSAACIVCSELGILPGCGLTGIRATHPGQFEL